jgi:hypothetical protein
MLGITPSNASGSAVKLSEVDKAAKREPTDKLRLDASHLESGMVLFVSAYQ